MIAPHQEFAYHRKGNLRVLSGMVAEIDFQPYLHSISNHYAQWWQLYTLTDAHTKTQKEPSPFDFGLMVQTMGRERSPSSNSPEGQDKEKIERFPVLEGIRKYVAEYRQVLLVGRPGSGKSTTLARLLLEEARGAFPSGSQDFANDPSSNPLLGGARGGLVSGATDRPTPPYGHPSEEGIGRVTDVARIPVLVELRFWSGSILDRIQAFFQRHQLQLDRTQIEDLLFHRRLLLLMDGLNELPSEAARLDVMKFRQDYPQVSMIFATRDLSLGGDFGLERKLEMQPLTEDQMKAFVRSYVPEQAEVMLGQLKKRLREFGQTPLLLWMLCGLFRQTGQIPANLGEVFRAFTQGYERNLKADVPIVSNRQWWPELLQELAFAMMHSQPVGANGIRPLIDVEFRVAIPQTEVRQIFAAFLQEKEAQAEGYAQKCLDDLLRHHLIQLNGGQVEFRHQLLQEYYAAEALLEQLPTLDDERLKQTYLNFLKWTAPLALMLALAENRMQAERVVRLAIDVDLMLAARLAGEVRPGFQGRTISLIEVLEVPSWLELNLLEETRSESTFPRLLQRLEDSDSYMRGGAANVLGKIGSEAIVPDLLQRLDHSDSGVRERAIDILGEIGSEAAIPGLLQCLDSDSYVRSRLVGALGKIGSEIAVPRLIQCLEDSDYYVRLFVAEALGKIGTEAAVPRLIQCLEDSDPEVRSFVAEALGKIGSEAAILGLLQQMENSRPEVHGTAVHALGTISSETVISGFIQRLGHANVNVRRSAAEMLGKIGSETVIPRLLQCLEHADIYVRESAAYVLGEIDNEEAIPGLLKRMEDSDVIVRGSAAAALGKIGSEVAIPGLLQQMKRSDSDVRRRAAYILGEIGSEKAIPGLLQRLKDSDSSVRGSAASALGKIRSEVAIPELLQRLDDSDSSVRENAASALGAIGSEVAIPGLLQYLEDSNFLVRRAAEYALGQIRPEFAIPKLLQRLEHSDSSVRRSATEALGKIGSEVAIPELLGCLEDSDSRVRRSAVEVLGKIGSESTIPGLLQRLEHFNSDVRRSAVEVLDKIGSESAIPGLLQHLEDSDPNVCWRAVSALGRFGSEAAIPGLLQQLENSDSHVRSVAVAALGKIGSEAAIPDLLQRLNDSDSDVRRSAADALGNISKKHANAIAPHLPHLFTLIPIKSGQEAHRVIRVIQENCKYYNYDIYQAYLEAQKRDQSESQTSDRSKIINNNFPNATEVKIIENVNQYHEAPPKDPSP